MTKFSLLNGLTDEQAVAVRDTSQQLCIIAGPGSGKTTVLTRRIALRALDPQISPKNTVAITFTNQAADELKIRLSSLAVYEMPWIGTFHGFAFQIIRKYHQELKRTVPILITNKAKDLSWILKNDPGIADEIDDITRNSTSGFLISTLLLSEIAREIELAKAHLIDPTRYISWRKSLESQPRLKVTTIASIYTAYENAKTRTNRLDFDDLVIRAGSIMEENPSFAQTVRWWFRHFYVDEFQDVNLAQINLLRNLIGEYPDLSVVGDPKQAIYTWNGASPALMLEFDKTFQGAKFRYLTRNFRSTPEIVDMANATSDTFVNHTTGAHGTSIYAQRPSGIQPRLLVFDDALDEATSVAKSIENLINTGAHPSEIAILARTNSLLPPFGTALTELGIAYQIIGVTHAKQDASTKSVLKHLIDVIGPRGRLKEGIGMIADLVEEYELDSDNTSKGDSPVDYLLQLATEAVRNDPEIDVLTFQNYFNVRASDVISSKKHGVTLTTLHRSKGLEWNTVFLVALEQDVLPHVKSVDLESFEEEKRLFYVGITRARDVLTLTYAKKRGNKNTLRRASEFLDVSKGSLGYGLPARASKNDALRIIESNRRRLFRTNATELDADPVLETIALWSKRKCEKLGTTVDDFASQKLIASIAKTLPISRKELEQCTDIYENFVNSYCDEVIKLCYALKRATNGLKNR